MKAHRPDWIFDSSEIDDPFGYGERAVDFIKKLKHPKSRLPDQAFDLPFFWERIVRRIYGPCDTKGNRQAKVVFCLLPRGARKTTIGAALSHLHTFGWERQPLGQAVVAASAEDQATIAYDEAVSVLDATPWLNKAGKKTESQFIIEHPKSGSTFRAISSDGGAQLGKTINFALCDELIAWKNRDTWKAIRTGLNKVQGSLLIVITQAGRGQENLAFDLLKYARKVASGEIIDPGFIPVLFETDADADWQDENLWHFVNPGLAEGFPDIDGLRQMAREAKERPADRDDFRQFHLNVWLDYSESPFVDMGVYDEGAGAVDLEDKEATQEPCWIGVDLSSNSDLTAVVAAWGDRERGYQVYPWFFCPEDNLQRRADRDGVPYTLWADQELITPTPGNVIDFRMVEDQIREICARFNVQEIAFDPHLARNTLNNLLEDGFPAVEMRQGWVTMAPAISELERAIIGRKFQHGGHPILRWHFDNIAVQADKAENKSFHKGKSKDRIDGAVAAAMAVGRASAGESNISSYDSDEWSEELAWA